MDTSTTVSATASGFFRNGLRTNPAQWSGGERAQELFQFVKDLHRLKPYLWYCLRHEHLLETINGFCAPRYDSDGSKHTFVPVAPSSHRRLALIQFPKELSSGITYADGLDTESRLFPCMPLVWDDMRRSTSRREYSVEEQFLLLTTKFEWVLFSRVMQATQRGNSSSVVHSCVEAHMKLISADDAGRRIEEVSLQVWYIAMIGLEWIVHRTIDVKEEHLRALAERAQLFHDRLARLHIELPLVCE